MSAQAPTQVKSAPTPVSAVKPAPAGLASHTCACGGSHGLGGECAECRQKRLRVQRRALKAPDLFEMQLKSSASAALNYHFGRVSVTQAHSRQSGDGQEAHDEQEADRAAAQMRQGSEARVGQSTMPLVIRRRALDENEETSAESAIAPEPEVTDPATSMVTEATPELASPETEPGSEPAMPMSPSASETPIGGLIVEDDVTPGLGQMSKNTFLDELRASACAAADAELVAVGRSTEGCPYVERLIGYYRTKSSEHIERALRKYAPEAAGVTSAREYIPLISERIRQGTVRWAQTGQISGVPQELLNQVSGAGVLSGVGSTVSSAVGGISGLFFKARDGGARQDADPQTIQSQLKGGHPLEGGMRTRLESAFGYDFSRVRVHTDGQAANLSSRLNARAFTIGSDVAFGAGEYRPGTLVGDALLAHELAHVVQQGGAESSSAVMQKGDTAYNALEEDADVSAVGAVVSLWSGAKSGLAKIAQNAMPRLKSGLGLQRCSNTPSPAVPRSETFEAPRPSAPPAVVAPSGPAVKFEGSLSTGNRLSFPSGGQTLGQKDLSDRWIWQVEIAGTVADSASNWKLKQSFTGRRKRVLRTSSGRLAPQTDDPLNVPEDDPLADFKQTSGQQFFWIDGPGHMKTVSGKDVDSLAQVQNFTSWVEKDSSKREVKWHLKTIVKTGGTLDTTNTKAGNDHISTN